MKILSLITHSFQSRKTFVHLRNTNLDIFDEIWELSDPNDRNEIDRNVVRTSINQWINRNFTNLRKYFFHAKKTKITFYLTILLPELRLPSFRRVPKNVIAVISIVYALGKARICVAILSKMEGGGIVE